MGATAATAEHSLSMASASAVVNVDWLPPPILTPPCEVLPGMTMIKLLPILEICAETFRLTPVPTASMIITALTPIMIPSMVRAERILLTHNALSAILRVERILIMIFSTLHR
ncbi:hypothetical protein ASZ90_007417 [hydrocarbon metagenome]|uniref:Uncharacterized protein n=1 Tax=hydrocarbon metagenome TaxID=938273 RepID=A0A0W8FPK4_9ZZZZ